MPLPDFLAAIHPADRAQVMRGMNRGIERGHMRLGFRVVLPSGKARRIVANGVMVASLADRDVTRMVGWFERRRGPADVKRSMTTSAHRMALMAGGAGVGFWRVDLTTDEQWLSPFTLGLFGFGPNESPTEDMFFAAVHSDDRDRLRAALDNAAERRGGFDEVYRIVPPGGQRWLHGIGAVVRDDLTGHDHLIGLAADVTDRVLAQKALLEREQQLAHLARVAVVGELSGAIAHEVSQPITAILNNSRAAERMLERADQVDRAAFQEILDDIMEASRRAGVVLRRVRDFLRNESLAFETIEVCTLVADVVALVRSELLEQRVAVSVDVDASLPRIRGDRVQLQQVLVNLILNACVALAAMPPADRQVVITGRARDDGTCELVVADCGPGIAPGQTERIFEPFVTSKPNGVGLGLALCRKLVTMHGGRIWAENACPGAAFHLVLPSAVEP